MKKSLLFLSLVIICLWACSSSEDIPPVFNNPNPVNLSQLEVGQKSYYRRYQVDCGSSSTFSYTGDTVVVEVIEDQGEKFFLEYFNS